MPGPDHVAPPSQPALPLQGLIILAVEDSRFACEALRLICQRSGARLRRAETMAQAERHLARYSPDVVIVDLGLPDGDGIVLVSRLARAGQVVLATSGDPDRRDAALSCGASAFLDKPIERIDAFQKAILGQIPGRQPRIMDKGQSLIPDRQALQDDLAHAAALLGTQANAAYVAAFLGSVAQSAGDATLALAADRAARTPAALPGLAALLTARLAAAPDVFARSDIAFPLHGLPE